MEVMFQNSDYLKNKYQAGGYEGWMADYLSGADLVKPKESDYEDTYDYFDALNKYYDDYNDRKNF
jgi:hypothetical protein